MTEQIDTDAVLASWSETLTEALDVSELTVDVKAVLALAADAAHAVIRPAAPLSTFIVGYAAGLAAAGGTDPEVAVREATEVARRLCHDRAV
ncbi:MAG TPA: DUF6457 domain-containing protein [Homoserinimonas sp.]|nr:DUF6457 domain-containing protein [Homoserinimonas sp.]